MEVRFTFRSEIYIKGKDLKEIKEKWEELNLFSDDAKANSADYVEMCSIERTDDDSYTDINNILKINQDNVGR